MKKILVPTDFSEAGNWAVEVAASIAKKMNAQVTLLHIVEQPTSESFNVEGQVDNSGWEDKLFTFKLIEKSKAQIAKVAESLARQGVNVKTLLRMGNPFHGMQTTITDHRVDLIIMGTFGHSKLEEIIIGSHTEKVVRHSKCPVLTVHQKPAINDFKKIVYATSMNEGEKDFGQVLREMQEIFGSEIHVVRINTPMNFKSDAEVIKLMDAFAKRLRLKNYVTHVFSDYSEEEGILHFANSVGADLIAMATHGRTGFAHVMVGSIAEDVVDHASKPVLTYVTRNSYQ